MEREDKHTPVSTLRFIDFATVCASEVSYSLGFGKDCLTYSSDTLNRAANASGMQFNRMVIYSSIRKNRFIIIAFTMTNMQN